MTAATTAKVELTIHKAEGLIALNPGGTSNPYITASIGDQSVSTVVANKTTHPLYDSTFTFIGCPMPTIMTFRVLNKLPYVDMEDPLGTATVTLFGPTPGKQQKKVQLGHGGNAALAQRATSGCGCLTITYEVTEVEAPPPASEPTPVVTPVPAAEPSVPQHANNFSSFAAMPAASLASNAPVGLVIPTVSPPPPTPGVSPAQSSTNMGALIPPSVQPAQPSPVGGIVVPQCASPPPPLATPLPVHNPSVQGYVSYLVPNVAPAPTAIERHETLASPAPPVALEMYYANNSSSASTGVASAPYMPRPITEMNTTSLAGFLPVASAVHVAPSASLVNSNTHLASSLAQTVVTHGTGPSTSTLYNVAAHAPETNAPQLPVVPPNIDGFSTFTPMPAGTIASSITELPISPPSPSSFPVPSVQIPSSQTVPEATVVSRGALPVAVAPRTPPLSQTSVTSSSTTPRSLPRADAILLAPSASFISPVTHQLSPVEELAAGALPSEPPKGAAYRDDKRHIPHTMSQRASVTPLDEPRHQRPALKARSCGNVRLHTRSRSRSTGEKDGGRPHACVPRRHPRQHQDVSSVANVVTASDVYADPVYLFEAAARGHDSHIFIQLREVDPLLTAGFTQCVDYAGRSLLHIAAWHGHLHLLEILFSPMPDRPIIDLRTLVATKSGNTILHAAACGGQGAVVQWLRYTHPTAGALLLGARNFRGMTAAECAKEAGFDHVARLLM